MSVRLRSTVGAAMTSRRLFSVAGAILLVGICVTLFQVRWAFAHVDLVAATEQTKWLAEAIGDAVTSGAIVASVALAPTLLAVRRVDATRLVRMLLAAAVAMFGVLLVLLLFLVALKVPVVPHFIGLTK